MTAPTTPDTADLNTVSKRLKYVINQSGIKQSHIAKKMGLTRGAVHYILNSDAKNSKGAKRIADLLGVNSEWLSKGEGPLPQKTEQMVNSSESLLPQFVPLYYLDQILLMQMHPEPSIQATAQVFAQHKYSQKTFAVQLSVASTLQKFEAGDIVIFAERTEVERGDWVLLYHAEEERILLGLVILSDTEQIALMHHKSEAPLLVNQGSDRILGVFVESIKYAKI